MAEVARRQSQQQQPAEAEAERAEVAELDSADDLLDDDDQFETNELMLHNPSISATVSSILGKHVPKDCPAIVKIKDLGMQAFMKETWDCKSTLGDPSGNYCLGKAATYFNRGKMAGYLENDEAIFQRMDVKDFGKAGFCVLKRGYGMSENTAGLAMIVYSKLACTEDNICINSSKKFYGGFELSSWHYSSSSKLQCFNRYKGCRYFADRMRNGKFTMVPSNKATRGLTQAFMLA